MKTKAKKEHKFLRAIRKVLPYALTACLIFALAKVGSDDKNSTDPASINMNTLAVSNSITADQLSELYVVASLSSSFSLASVDTVASNYVAASVLKEVAQTNTDRIEKPGYVTIQDSRGVKSHIVKEGETMASIAGVYGVTTDQIRWSNGLKTTDITIGTSLKIPGTSGIVYEVRAGDTAASLASRYSSDADRIIAYNDLESTGLVAGAQIVLPNGILPLTERPEYVPVYQYSYYGNTSDRQNMRVVYENVTRSGTNRMVWGQCTYYAWWWRENIGSPLPAALTGDAKYWGVNASALGLRVDHTPSYGAVFQTTSGWYGHVGVVTQVNDDGSIVVREMNYGYRVNVITESTIPANIVGNFNYIH